MKKIILAFLIIVLTVTNIMLFKNDFNKKQKDKVNNIILEENNK